MEFAVYIPVGPGESEIYRLLDLLDSLVVYGESIEGIILVDDCFPHRELAGKIDPASGLNVVVLSNPREGRGNGSTGGLCVSDLVAFEYAQREMAVSFVLKLDTDSLVVHPFVSRIESQLETYSNLGLLGVVGDSFGSNRTFNYTGQVRSYFERLISLPQDIENIDVSAYPELRLMRQEERATCSFLRLIVNQVISRNAELGRYCQGGGYVVSRRFLDAMADGGYFGNPVRWKDLRIGEDIFISTCCAAVGLDICDSSGAGSAFAIHPGCLPLSCEEILALDRSIIHSLKGSNEAEFRAFFRQDRKSRFGLPTSGSRVANF